MKIDDLLEEVILLRHRLKETFKNTHSNPKFNTPEENIHMTEDKREIEVLTETLKYLRSERLRSI